MGSRLKPGLRRDSKPLMAKEIGGAFVESSTFRRLLKCEIADKYALIVTILKEDRYSMKIKYDNWSTEFKVGKSLEKPENVIISCGVQLK